MNNLQSWQIIPHAKAPLFSEKDWRLKLQHAIDEITSQNFQATESVREILRQAGFVNLWFFLKCIASFNGPYGDLTDHVHMEMCNFYQQQMMIPGGRAAGFVPRSFFKSTIWTHGGNTFEINRDPKIRIGLVSGIADRAVSFMRTSQATFDSNELFAWLYPENAVTNQRDGWSNKMTIHPSRTIAHPEPTIQLVTAGGSSQGVHAGLLKIDDIVGDSELDSEHMAGAEMLKRANWLKSNTETLLLDWTTSRIMVVGTRYAVDDPYAFIMEDTKWATEAFKELPYSVREDGTWDVYYRLIKEDGKIILPERFTEVKLQKLYEKDPWTYWSQYFNNPHKAQSSDMDMYEFKQCWLEFEDGEPIIVLPGVHDKIYVADCDVVQCVDPAASERRKDSKTSRSAQLTMATDCVGRHFFIHGHAGYEEVKTVWSWMLKSVRLFGRYLRLTGLEQQGAFKLLGPLFRDWAQRDQVSQEMKLRDVRTSGDKDARIRSHLQPPLSQGKLYAVEGPRELLQQELDVFPGARRKDVLDAAAMCLQMAQQPMEPLRRVRRKKMFKRARQVTSSVTGY